MFRERKLQEEAIGLHQGREQLQSDCAFCLFLSSPCCACIETLMEQTIIPITILYTLLDRQPGYKLERRRLTQLPEPAPFASTGTFEIQTELPASTLHLPLN